MENTPKSKLEMHTLLLCTDVPFLGITRNVLNQLHVTPKMVNTSAAALAMIQAHEFDAMIVDWREIDNLVEFLTAVRRSKLNQDCVLLAIMRDLLDMRQAFAAGVHFLIHKPASAVQIERCLRAAYNATVARRRKQHREPVAILASVSTRTQPFGEATLVNLSEGGAKLRTSVQDFVAGVSLSAGDELDLRFALPRCRGNARHRRQGGLGDRGYLRSAVSLRSGEPADGPRAVAHGMRGALDFPDLRAHPGGLRVGRILTTESTEEHRANKRGPLTGWPLYFKNTFRKDLLMGCRTVRSG